ncbi:MAG: 50S ribosomal protein L32e [Conexivisphaerales archaeon]
MKKHKFVRQESWRYKKLKVNWRKPKGIDNKMRLQMKGWPPLVKVGYRSIRKGRGLHPSGLQEVLVHNVRELSEIDPIKQAARIAATVGFKKRLDILKEARRMGVHLLNAPRLKQNES